ncbi:MAG TPA: DUF983 domain-containing protein [Xanthobacteraceae bacterium]|jgi:uncharacterized protein (DUF983 family)
MNSLPPVSPYSAGLRCRCPRCGKGRLFNGFLELAPRCESCSLDFSFADSGDGPAVFVILIAGFLVVFAAMFVEIVWRPPYWLHAALWLPLILIATLGLLRPAKGLMVALQYHHKAEEGRLDRSGE